MKTVSLLVLLLAVAVVAEGEDAKPQPESAYVKPVMHPPGALRHRPKLFPRGFSPNKYRSDVMYADGSRAKSAHDLYAQYSRYDTRIQADLRSKSKPQSSEYSYMTPEYEFEYFGLPPYAVRHHKVKREQAMRRVPEMPKFPKLPKRKPLRSLNVPHPKLSKRQPQLKKKSANKKSPADWVRAFKQAKANALARARAAVAASISRGAAAATAKKAAAPAAARDRKIAELQTRMTKAEARMSRQRSAFMAVAKQLETDEERTNKHARVLTRLRQKSKVMKAQIAELQARVGIKPAAAKVDPKRAAAKLAFKPYAKRAPKPAARNAAIGKRK